MQKTETLKKKTWPYLVGSVILLEPSACAALLMKARFAAILFLLSHPVLAREALTVGIDSNFPGGNVLVTMVGLDTLHLGPDMRDSMVPWFYWYYRIREVEGRKLTFVFDKANVGVRGPAVSLDAGRTWKWLGAEAVVDGTFSFTIPAGAPDVRFSVGMPYVGADLERCLARHQGNPFLHIETLTKTRKGRDVTMLRIGDKAKKPRYAIAITGRHHCCEMMASYTLEGIIEGALADDAAGHWLRAHVEFLFVPFMDTDGVEDGDQGKNRSPFDHNRDYASGTPRYPEVAALKERIPAWSAGRPLVFLDLHDPALRSDIHEVVHFLEPEEPLQAARMDKLCTYLERDQQGPILYRKAHNLRFGSGYNKIAAKPAPISSGWARSLPNTLLGCTVEIPYANAGGCEVNTHSARELGRDLAVALMKFLRDAPEVTDGTSK
ncbi:MAG: M14 family zinc carboxypeptidase [Roseimicrobium sp.]